MPWESPFVTNSFLQPAAITVPTAPLRQKLPSVPFCLGTQLSAESQRLTGNTATSFNARPPALSG